MLSSRRDRDIMAKPSFKKIAARSTELVVAVLFALAFFLVFLGLLFLAFPSGTSFSTMLRTAEEGFLPGSGEGGRSAAGFAGGANAAHLAVVRNKVKSKSSSEIAWKRAVEGMELFDRHAVQTFDRSSAVIRFDERNALNVGDNSVVIIRRLDRDPLFREKRSFLVVVDGELRGSIAATPESSVFLEIETPSAVTRIRTRDAKEGKVDFRIAVDPGDKSSTISVLRGSAEIEAAGRTVAAAENTSTLVSPDGLFEKPRPLPEPVRLEAPADDAVLFYRDLPPRIVFTWRPVAGAADYLFTLGRDPFLSDVIIEDRLARASFSHGNLRSGTYYWRVDARTGARDAPLSETRRFTIINDSIPPLLTVEFPPATVNDSQAVVTGMAEAGCRVFVMGTPVATDRSGRFTHRVSLREGVNIVLIEAVDAAGNTSYRSQMVNAKF